MNRAIRWIGTTVSILMSTAGCGGEVDQQETLENSEQAILVEELVDSLPNDFPIVNGHGTASSVSTQGRLALDNAFFTAQGTNGRHCGSCHAPEDGWSIRPSTVNILFLLTGGTHPIFSVLDADRPDADLSTVASRWNSFKMLRQGKFTRSVTPPATRDYDVIAADDPFGWGTTSRLWFFRRPLPTANFLSHTVMWDAANTVGTSLRDGLIRQARGNVTGAQQGPPASDETIFAMVDYEMSVSHAQRTANGAGSLSAAGARGGATQHSTQALVNGRFNLFDAWRESRDPQRRQIARGQEVFNNVNTPSGRSCRGCHNAENNGQNVGGALFDVGVSRPQFKRPDMAVYTFQSRVTGEIIESTDPGQGIRNGQFASLNRFKTPNLRGLASRAPYFHNGIATDLAAVVRHYEVALGFDFTRQEEQDLVAFMNAL